MYTWPNCPFHGTSAGKRRLKMIESYKPSYWQQKCTRISWQWKNICHTKQIQLVCEVGRKTYVSLSQFPLFHILKLMDKITSIFGSYRFLRRPLTVLQKICHKENCEQRTMHALSEEFDPFELRRGLARACFFGNDRSSHSRVRTRLITKSVFYEWASDSFAYPCPCNNS